MKKHKVVCLLAITTLIISISTDLYAAKIKRNINLHGVTLHYNSPPWSSGNKKDILNESRLSRQQKGPLFVIESIPKDQKFESWKTLFGIKANKYQTSPNIDQWVYSNLIVFKQNCNGYQSRLISKNKHFALVYVFCPAIKKTNLNQNKEKTGEIAVFSFFTLNRVAISHYLEWRGKAFTIANKNSWPVSENEFKRGIQIIGSAVSTDGKKIAGLQLRN